MQTIYVKKVYTQADLEQVCRRWQAMDYPALAEELEDSECLMWMKLVAEGCLMALAGELKAPEAEAAPGDSLEGQASARWLEAQGSREGTEGAEG